MDDNLYIKFSLDNRAPRYGTEPMPDVGGTATEARGVKLCEFGWHACLPGAGGAYLGTEAYLVRLSGTVRYDGTKVVGSTVETVARLPWSRADLVDFAHACDARAGSIGGAHADVRATEAAKAARAASTSAAYAAEAAAAGTYLARGVGCGAERRAQWDWIIARLRENGADLTGVYGT